MLVLEAASPHRSAMAQQPPTVELEPQPSTIQERQAWATAAGIVGANCLETLSFGPSGAERWRLTNGLEVVMAADPHAGVAAVHVWVRAGSADEAPGQTGAAHLLEHLMFKGTKARPAGVFDRELEAHGANTNAATWLDWTMYHQVVPSQVVPLVLAMEADRMVNLHLTVAGVRSELSVVKNERRETIDTDVDGQIAEAMARLVHGNSVYAHPVIGWAADLEAMTRDTALAFYRAHYATGRTAVVVTGTFDQTTVLREIVKSFGPLPTTVATKRAPAGQPTVQLTAEVRKTMTIDAAAARLAIAWPTVALASADHPALVVLAEALCGGESARLHRSLVDEHKLASSVGCFQDETRLQGSFNFIVTLRPGHSAQAALIAVDAAVVALLSSAPLTATEFANASRRLTTSHYRQLANADGRADVLGQTWANWGDLAGYAAMWNQVAKLQVSDVQAAAKRWLAGSVRAIVLADPPPPPTAKASRRGGPQVVQAKLP
ncbi:MAG: insulinase family protein [Myxococcales bacterium]|nr:insulinase family protein [Myxococcales bacterium]